jgi:hypothetical protein
MPEKDRQKRFDEGMDRLMQSPGYGPPDAKLWICGAEERGPTAKFDDEWVINGYHHTKPRPAFNLAPGEAGRSAPAWRRSFELALRMSGRSGDPWSFGKVWCEQPNLLHLTNMLIVPRHTVSHWELQLLSQQRYLQSVVEKRLKILRERRPPSSVVVCHTVRDTRHLAASAFVNDGEEGELVTASDGRSFRMYRESRTILCPFFRTTLMTNVLFEQVCKATTELLEPQRAAAS